MWDGHFLIFCLGIDDFIRKWNGIGVLDIAEIGYLTDKNEKGNGRCSRYCGQQLVRVLLFL